MKRPSSLLARPRSTGGFTLVELLLVLALAMILMLIGFPALQNMISRSKIEGASRQTEAFLRLARFEAIKRGVQVAVRANFANNRLIVFVNDANKPNYVSATDTMLAYYVLPEGVSFWGAQDPSPNGGNALMNIPNDNDGTSGGGEQYFNPDGSAAGVNGATGFNLGDKAGNFMEVRIPNPIMPKVELRKWNPSYNAYLLQGQNGQQWQWN